MSPWPGSYVQSLPSFSLLKAAYSALPWAREVLPEAPCTPGYRSNRELEEFLILLPLELVLDVFLFHFYLLLGKK